jgi:hypothetical protein
MPVQKRGDKWHYAFCIRGVRYRGAIPEARTKFEAEKAETKIRQDVYEGRYVGQRVCHNFATTQERPPLLAAVND